ncbi:MAG: hypothetical protein QXJ06_00150 [Candidatus Aenigmatarchaeota archaeon]
MKKKELFILFFILLFLSSVKSQGVGVGLSSYSINISGSLLDYYVSTIRVINPSPYEIKVKVYFDCKDCTTDIKIFGKKIAEKTVDYKSFFIFDKYDITVKPMTFGSDAPPIKIIFSPKFITKNHLRIYTPEALNFFIKLVNKNYQNSFVIPCYSLFLGERKLSGLIVAEVYESSFGEMGVAPSVGSNIDITAKGMPISSFIILCLLIVLLGIFIFKKIKQKSSKEKHKK